MPSRPHHLLFICSGNICRSPLAEHIAASYADRTGVDVIARSAGTLGLTDRPAEPQMVKVGREIGLDLSGHVCQPITDVMCDWADRIFAMEYGHIAHLEEFHPPSRGKTELLGRHGGVDEISDPIGAWFSFRYRSSRKLIEKCVQAAIDKMPSEIDF